MDASGIPSSAWTDRGRLLRLIHLFSVGLLGFALATCLPVALGGQLPFDAFGHPLTADLPAHLTGGRLVMNGEAGKLYDARAQWAAQQALLGNTHPEALHWFVSPPFVALLYLPLAHLPYLVAVAAWSVLTVSVLAPSLILLWPAVADAAGRHYGTLALLTASSWPTIELLADGQDCALALLIQVAALRLLMAGREVLAGAVLGLGLYKPQLFLVIPLLLVLQHRWRAFLAATLVALGLSAVSFALVGREGLVAYLTLVSSPEFQAGTGSVDWKMLSLLPFVRSLLPSQLAELATPLTIVLDSILVAAFIRRCRRRQSTEFRPEDLGLTILVGCLVSPYFFMYDSVLLIVPLAILVRQRPHDPAALLAVVAAFALSWTTLARQMRLQSVLPAGLGKRLPCTNLSYG